MNVRVDIRRNKDGTFNGFNYTDVLQHIREHCPRIHFLEGREKTSFTHMTRWWSLSGLEAAHSALKTDGICSWKLQLNEVEKKTLHDIAIKIVNKKGTID